MEYSKEVSHKRGILLIDFIPFPNCHEKCKIVKLLGVGECESCCSWKFDKEGNSINETLIKERLKTWNIK